MVWQVLYVNYDICHNFYNMKYFKVRIMQDGNFTCNIKVSAECKEEAIKQALREYIEDLTFDTPDSWTSIEVVKVIEL